MPEVLFSQRPLLVDGKAITEKVWLFMILFGKRSGDGVLYGYILASQLKITETQRRKGVIRIYSSYLADNYGNLGEIGCCTDIVWGKELMFSQLAENH